MNGMFVCVCIPPNIFEHIFELFDSIIIIIMNDNINVFIIYKVGHTTSW
jgi:hypothetical protein